MGRYPANRNRFHPWLHISFRGLPNRRKKEDHHNGTWHYLSVASSVDRRHHDHEFDESCILTTTGVSSMDNSSSSTERRSLISLDSCVSTSSARSNNEHKQVHFGNCEVRRYSQVLGDHPYCSNGCPIELGWSYLETTKISVDDYEQDRSSVDDDNNDLRLSYEERRTILSGYTDGEVRRSNRRMNREQRCCQHHSHRNRHHNKGVSLFFSVVDETEEVPQVPPAVQD